MIPGLGLDVAVAYFADDGLDYQIMTNRNLLLAGNWIEDAFNSPYVPWYVVPRHLVCLYNDAIDRVTMRLIVPIPFRDLPFEIPPTVVTSSGLPLSVIARVGERRQPYDLVD